MDRKTEVYNTLCSADCSVTSREIAEALGWSVHTVAQALQKLKRDRKVTSYQDGCGTYWYFPTARMEGY